MRAVIISLLVSLAVSQGCTPEKPPPRRPDPADPSGPEASIAAPQSLAAAQSAPAPDGSSPSEGALHHHQPGMQMGTPPPVDGGSSHGMPGMKMDMPGMKMEMNMSNQPATTQYTCPMHPEIVSPKPGRCPKCGMVLVPIKNAKP